MEKLSVWYITDNGLGRSLAQDIKDLGIQVNVISLVDSLEANFIESVINFFIFDCTGCTPDEVMRHISGDHRLEGFTKFVILPKKGIRELSRNSYNLMHLEFISRPLDNGLFLLMLEKAMVAERFRELMKNISLESEARIEAFEGLLDINRKKVFQNDREKQNFESILDYEKNFLNEQSKLNEAISEFSYLRHNEIFELNQRINAEEMLGDLRRRELMEANSIITVQNSVITYSAQELDEARDIIEANQKIAELSRSEALELHQEIERVRKMNETLAQEMEMLMGENEQLKIMLNRHGEPAR